MQAEDPQSLIRVIFTATSVVRSDTAIVGAACSDPTDPTKFVTVQAVNTVSLRSIPFIPIDLLPETITETVTMRCGG